MSKSKKLLEKQVELFARSLLSDEWGISRESYNYFT